MVEVTDVYGVTRNYDSADARDKVRQTERETALLEAAKTGDYSNIAGYSNSSGSDRAEIKRQGANILRQSNMM